MSFLAGNNEAFVDCVVYGTKDPNVQELISAVVVKNPKINVSELRKVIVKYR